MVFTTTNLFKTISCPEGAKCNLTSCIYAHDAKPDSSAPDTESAPASNGNQHSVQNRENIVEPPAKRRKITYSSFPATSLSKADQIRNELAAERGLSRSTASASDTLKTGSSKSQAPSSLHKPISPPPVSSNATLKLPPQATIVPTKLKSDHNGKSAAPETNHKTESLNPRLIANDPAGHAKRQLYLKHLHAELARLNETLNESSDLENKRLLHLTEQEVISFALDVEERMARDHPTIYGNVVKQRVSALKKMSVDDWVKEVKSSLGRGQPKPPAKRSGHPIVTGLPLSQEILILPHLVAEQKPLAAFGYVVTPPTEEATAEAAAAVLASKNYELCDRCSARFQVFPDRNELGLLTGQGSCTFHPNRKIFPQRSKTDKETGPKEPYYPCCNETVGAPGCTTNEQHVFKTSSPARLAAVLPFITTPENPSPAKDRRGRQVEAVAFDCEMGYTVNGMELIRLTAVAWPDGLELVDVLVRPLGVIIDLNTRFSGITGDDYANAVPYDEWENYIPPPPAENHRSRLPVVDSPKRARELLCSFLSPSTPLLGHAIDNDLNTVRLCHPTIVDTVLLFAHPKGLPMRFGLKMLAARYLRRDIQSGGAHGHDSKEDAVATGDLVRVKVGETWKQLRLQGWQIVNGNQLLPPAPPSTNDQERKDANVEANAEDVVDKTIAGRKRKRPPADGAGNESTESEDDKLSGLQAVVDNT